MSNYYQTLNKEQKEKIKEEYRKSYQNSELNNRLIRLKIYSIISIIMALLILVLSFIFEDKHITSILTAIVLFIAATMFLIGEYKIKLNLLNKIALKRK